MQLWGMEVLVHRLTDHKPRPAPASPGPAGGSIRPTLAIRMKVGPDTNRRGQPKGQCVLFGFGGRGVWFGLQKKPGLASCGSISPALTSCPYDCA